MSEATETTLFDTLKQVVQNSHHDDADNRRKAVFALENYPQEEVYEYALMMLEDPNRGVREAAAELEKNNREWVAMVLKQIKQYPTSPYVQYLARRWKRLPSDILVNFIASAQQNELLLSELRELITHEDSWVSVSALEIIGMNATEDDLVKSLQNLFRNPDAEPDVLQAAIQVAGNRKLLRLKNDLESLTGHQECEVSSIAKQAVEYFASLMAGEGDLRDE